MKLNLPNKLTVLRLILVPVFVIVLMIPTQTVQGYFITTIIGMLIFGLASYTDHLDGKIARERNLITDFGKFLDPLADKFMVLGALIVALYRYGNIRFIYTWAVLIVVFRELAVTSMRLMVSGSAHIVIAANKLGKIKTGSQVTCILVTYLEPLIYETINLIGGDNVRESGVMQFLVKYPPLTYLCIAVMIVFTVWSGINYILTYWKYLDPNK
ncbi:MAG: CDP-diacylglycerol--glycerol-3-phosphate 3-phosphatidyltransferase [Clostridia bacterium]|nr:CDP-diacylglycerol--glycerol-3-phosphate 3-phosphatidyltransferase [Clostridia bacterium]